MIIDVDLLSKLFSGVPGHRLLAQDGNLILSIEDVRRRRLAMASLFLAYVGIVYSFSKFSLFDVSIGNPLVLLHIPFGAMLCAFGLWSSLWHENIKWDAFKFVAGLSAIFWFEAFFTGSYRGYYAIVVPIIPLLGALMLTSRGTLVITFINLALVFVMATRSDISGAIFAISNGHIVSASLSLTLIALAMICCAAGAFMMAHQSEKIDGQLRDLVHYQSHLANHDQLSGLGNRTKLQKHFDDCGPNTSFDILLIDLDGFKAVNDTFGHDAGDYLITAVSERLRETTDEGDLLIRLGGDEFMVLLENIEGSLGNVRRYGDHLIDVISRPYAWKGNRLNISASIGHSRFPQHASTPSKVMSLADKALYVAKNMGKGRTITYGVKPKRTANAAKPGGSVTQKRNVA